MGKLNDNIINEWELEKHKDKYIVMYQDAKEHCEKHISNFSSREIYDKVMNSLDKIIKYPDYCFYDKSKKGLEIYKKIDDNVMIAVRVNEGKKLRIRSVYPVSEIKILNRKKKEEQQKLYN